MTEAPSSRVSSVVSMLGDFNAFCASFLTLGDVITAGALAISQFYFADIGNMKVQLSNSVGVPDCVQGMANFNSVNSAGSCLPSANLQELL